MRKKLSLQLNKYECVALQWEQLNKYECVVILWEQLYLHLTNDGNKLYGHRESEQILIITGQLLLQRKIGWRTQEIYLIKQMGIRGYSNIIEIRQTVR